MSNVLQLYKEIVALDLLDDRREYDVEDLMSAYDLNKADAKKLYNLIKDVKHKYTNIRREIRKEIKEEMKEKFSQGHFSEGLSSGILKAGEALQKYFPHERDDKNELSDHVELG